MITKKMFCPHLGDLFRDWLEKISPYAYVRNWTKPIYSNQRVSFFLSDFEIFCPFAIECNVVAQRFPKWPHKSDGPFSCAAKRENHFSWICAHLLPFTKYLYSFAMCESCQETAEKPAGLLDKVGCWILKDIVTHKMATVLTQFLIFFYLQKFKKFWFWGYFLVVKLL